MNPRRDPEEPDLWIVAAADDGVAEAVGEVASAQGCSTARVSFAEFAQSLTIDFSGSRTRIRSSGAVLLRATWESSGEGADASFLALEDHAQVWAACALWDAPVINRPGVYGVSGLADHLTSLSVFRARRAGHRVALVPEVYSSDWMQMDGDWAAQDLVSFDTAVVPARPEGDGPYRYRQWDSPSGYQMITVVDGQGWAATPDCADELIERSVEIVGALGLRFGAVTWGLSAGAGDVARIEAQPSSWTMGQHLPQVAEALVHALIP